MGLSRRFLLWCSEQRWLGQQAQKRRFTRTSVLRFMPGENIDAALQAAGRFREHRITTILHELGENVTEPEEADLATAHYREALDRIAAAGLDGHISIKLTHLGLDIDEELAFRNLAALVEHADRRDGFVWVDMEGSAYTDRTVGLFARVKKMSSRIGLCLQAYLYRTARDVDELLSTRPTIRLVKGAYNEPAEIAHPRKKDVDESFFRLSERLLGREAREKGAHLAVGTHDLGLIERVFRYAESIGVPKDEIEIQMLYGIQREAQVRLAQQGRRVRVLISYGTDWYPWFVRRLAERPANLWFLLRNIF